MREDEKKKLSLLLIYWIEHNRSHKQDFKRWAEKANTFDVLVYDELMDAVNHMEEVSVSLSNALERLNNTRREDEKNR